MYRQKTDFLWQKVSLLVLFLSVSNDVNQVLVVQVPGHIWGEGSEHLLHLTNKKKTDLTITFIRALHLSQRQHIAQCALKRRDDDSQWNVCDEDVHGCYDDYYSVCVKGVQCTSSGENRSACVVNICVTLNRKKNKNIMTWRVLCSHQHHNGFTLCGVIPLNPDSYTVIKWVNAYITPLEFSYCKLTWCEEWSVLHHLLVLPQHPFPLRVEDFKCVENGLLRIGT